MKGSWIGLDPVDEKACNMEKNNNEGSKFMMRARYDATLQFKTSTSQKILRSAIIVIIWPKSRSRNDPDIFGRSCPEESLICFSNPEANFRI